MQQWGNGLVPSSATKGMTRLCNVFHHTVTVLRAALVALVVVKVEIVQKEFVPFSLFLNFVFLFEIVLIHDSVVIQSNLMKLWETMLLLQFLFLLLPLEWRAL
jgi:hypothetical protein